MLSADSMLVVDVFSKVSWWRLELRDELLPRVQATRDAEEELVMRLAGRRFGGGVGRGALRGYPLKRFLRRAERGSRRDAWTIREAFVSWRGNGEMRRRIGICRWGLEITSIIGWRDAALDGLRDAGVLGNRVRFYEDLPYAAEREMSAIMRRFWRSDAGVDYVRNSRWLEKCARFKAAVAPSYASQLTESQIQSVVRYARRAAEGRSGCGDFMTKR